MQFVSAGENEYYLDGAFSARAQRSSRSSRFDAAATFDCNCIFNLILLVLGMYGNDDFHNGMLQTCQAARQIESLVHNFTNKVNMAELIVFSILTSRPSIALALGYRIRNRGPSLWLNIRSCITITIDQWGLAIAKNSLYALGR